MDGYWIEMIGDGGVLERRFVWYEGEIRQAVIDLINGMPYLSGGDKIVITEGWSEQ